MPYARVKNELPLIPGYSEGAIAYASDAAAAPLNKCICYINPVQDLHGQDYPYPSGGGKNKLPMTVANLKANNTSGSWNGNVYTNGTVTYTLQTDEGNNVTGIVVNGTPSGTNTFSLGSYTIDSGTYALSGCASGGSASTYYVDVRNDGGGQVIDSGSGASFTSSEQSGKYGRIVVTSGTAMSNKLFTPMLRLSSASSSYAPYSNICPITGHTELNLVQKDGTDTVVHTYTTDLGTTVYGGTLDVETGVLTVTKGYIASYDGETLPSDWICDRAVYESGTTPPTGSQVVYTLATPTTIQLTPQEVTTLLGENSFYHDCNGDTKITFIRRLDS